MTDEDAGREREPVGSLADEATKLLAALQDWAKESGSQYAAAASAGAGLHDLDAHLAGGGRDCTYCPVCRVISAVRGTTPEVREHLRSAAGSLVAAMAGMLAPPAPEPAEPHSGSPVEKIQLSDDEWEDD
jgi:hypothetical protein